MSIKTKQAPAIEPETPTTIWIGDPAVDIDASDIDKWCATADKKYLKLKPKSSPTEITFRGLTPREVRMLPRARTNDVMHPLYFVEAAKFGVVSLSDVVMRRADYGGVMGLGDETANLLDDQVHDIPLLLALRNAWGSKDKTKESVDYVPTSLLEWLGCHVVALTFRKQ